MTGIPERSGARERTRIDLHRLIRSRNGITRAELIASTGLSRSTVNHAVAQLLDTGLVEEAPAQAKGPGTGSGRPSTVLRASKSGAHLAAIDFGHNHVHVALADASGAELARVETEADVDMNCREALEIATTSLRQLMEQNNVVQVSRVVAGVPGPIDIATGLVRSPTILSSWVGLSPARELETRLGMPIHVENDSVLGALGELHSGAGQHYENFIYVKASHGIGAGLIVNRRPYRGWNGLAGEIGHTALAGESELCRCGNRGCLEAVVSVSSIRNRLSHTHPDLDPGDLTASIPDDAIAWRILEDAGRTIGRVLADFANLLNPEAIIIGGEIGGMGAPVTNGIRASIDRHAQPATAASLNVSAAALGTDAELIGGLQLAAALEIA